MSAPAFDPSKHLEPITRKLRDGREVSLGDYLAVKWRVAWLRAEHPDATIETEIVAWDESSALFKARVSIPGGGTATGFGSETRSDFGDYIEKAETKAVGRALAHLGFGTQFAVDLDEGGSVADSPTEGRRPAGLINRTAPIAVAQSERPSSAAWSSFWKGTKAAGWTREEVGRRFEQEYHHDIELARLDELRRMAAIVQASQAEAPKEDADAR